MKKIGCIKITVFLAAFLLFQIELIISKLLLPKFGGSYTVWGAALVFFQATLLLGYLYSHLVIKKYGIAKYRYLHLGLIALTLLFFPGRALPAISTNAHLPIVLTIFWQLSHSIGPVFFLLSTTSIIFQSWLSESDLKEKSNPYALYGVSNLGSFLALLTYPFFFEANFDLNFQLKMWRIAYLVLIGLHLLSLRLVKTVPEAKALEAAPALARKDVIRWLLLGAGGVIMFLSITNLITYELMPIPLLWILPLSIYLISFTLNFRKKPWCPLWIRQKFHLTVAIAILLFFLMHAKILEFMIVVIGYLVVLFIICMFCQNELYVRRPSDSRQLTYYYFIISLGSFCGGIFVSWIVPLFSALMIEYLLGLLVISIALALDEKKISIDIKSALSIAAVVILLIVWPLFFRTYNVFAIILLGLAFGVIYTILKTRAIAFAVSLLTILCVTALPMTLAAWTGHGYVYVHRNYYGIYRIFDEYEKRHLLNGSIMHGAQYLVKERQKVPLTYYSHYSPMGLVLDSKLFDIQRIAAVGLGAGTIAAYSTPSRIIDFYELDPDVYKIADKYFTYLKDTPGKVNHIMGDARLTLARSPEGYYDVLVIDAFSGESVPAHLLTIEAINEYRKHLKPDGIILFHVSNRYIYLEPVLFANARKVEGSICISYGSTRLGLLDEITSSAWAALTWDKDAFQKLTTKLGWSAIPETAMKGIRPWTDSYTNPLRVLRLTELVNQVKNFRPFYWDFRFKKDRGYYAAYYSLQGERSILEKDFSHAVNYFEKSLEINPDDVKSLGRLGIAYAKMGDKAKAVDYYKKALVKTEDHLKKALEADPKDPRALWGLGSLYYHVGLKKQAIELIKKAAEASPNVPALLNNVGNILTREGQMEEAAEYYRRAIAIDPNNYTYYLNIGNAYSVLGRDEEALASLRLAIDRNPDAYYARQAYAAQKSVMNYKNILKGDPDNIQALRGLGDMRYKLMQYDEAIKYYEKALERSPDDTVTLCALGAVYQKLRKNNDAVTYYEKAISIKQDDVLAHIGIAAAYASLGQREKSVEHMNRAKDIFKSQGNNAMADKIDEVLKMQK